jgi:hypothetical protein
MTAEAVALDLCARLLGVAVALQSVELLQLRAAWSPGGIWTWEVLQDDLRGFPAPARSLLAPLLRPFGFTCVVALRLAAAVLLVAAAAPAALPILLAAQVLIGVRWRGAFNGGSDAMTLVVLLGLCVAALAPDVLLVQRGALLHIALQAALSYFVAGVVKLRGRRWRDGTALFEFVRCTRYQAPATAQRWLARRPVAVAASWAVMLFDTGFPLALLHPTACHVVLALALLFHLANVWLFGLNRFLFAWAAAWPAVWYASVLLWPEGATFP